MVSLGRHLDAKGFQRLYGSQKTRKERSSYEDSPLLPMRFEFLDRFNTIFVLTIVIT